MEKPTVAADNAEAVARALADQQNQQASRLWSSIAAGAKTLALSIIGGAAGSYIVYRATRPKSETTSA